ncbi:hypothetical protein B1987_12380 [Mycobacterium kansasii]|uniref:Transposase n=2 Tax=Mycobacterium attenuatum TaxID=2341086 RepID=A0A498QEP6_9MYCO|nr:hypothetical protein B1987_12380 [Mycobacterium kansasii]VBA43459.1 hypothetical protein LAUMK136_05096 [Mycobacterium attenuatum]
MRADNTAPLHDATRERTAATRRRADEELRAILSSGERLSVAEFARRAGVSRSWLYNQSDLIGQLAGIQPLIRADGVKQPLGIQAASDESIRTRLELAHRRIRTLSQQNQELSDQLARVLGELRAARVRGTATRSA